MAGGLMRNIMIIKIYIALTSLLLRERTGLEWRAADSGVTAPEGTFS
jgi:hypothetical protein